MNLLIKIRESRFAKCFAVFLALNLVTEILFPTVSYALTSGPAQEEFASFEPVSTSDMVDIYSGDFNYNIPLLSVPGPNGGYPINLAYHSGVGMDQEASWVGLGWNVNVGAINRQLRGLPDDFAGGDDKVTRTMNLRTNTTIGYNTPPKKQLEEIFGLPPTPEADGCSPVSWQIYYNNYKGMGYRAMFTCDKYSKNKVGSVGVGISFDSQNGIGIEPSLSSGFLYRGAGLNFELGLSLNSRQGLQDFSFSTSILAQKSAALGSGAERGIHRVFKSGQGAIATSSLSFASIQSVPQVTIPTVTNTYPFDIKIGKSPGFGYFTAKPGLLIGYVSRSVVETGGVTKEAFGYLNTVLADGDEDLRDFQREDIPYSKKVPNLSPASHTYDLFMHTGQGTGGMFRPYSSSVGILTDPVRENPHYTERLNLEFGASAAAFHVGLGFTVGAGSSNASGGWQDVDGTSGLDANLPGFNFIGTGDPAYEGSYFQMYGEKTGVLDNGAEDQLSAWQGDQAMRVMLKEKGSYLTRQFEATNEFLNTQPHTSSTGTAIAPSGLGKHKNTRQRRGTMIQALPEDMAVTSEIGLTKYTGYTITPSTYTPKLKVVENHSKHISEYSILQPDGMRYVYGLPAYNRKQMDASFSVENNAAGCTTCNSGPNIGDFNTATVCVPNDGSGNIKPSPDKAEAETSPYPEFLSQTELAAYVHSWLLTAVVSADYVDLTGNGPTEDDYGYWVKFNYDKKVQDYKWRVPYQDAMFSEGNKSDPTDDKGSFTYGEKDLYYLQSIESKTHIAVFELSKREDALPALSKFATCGEKETAADKRMQKIDKIKLFTKREFFGACPEGSDIRPVNQLAIPIKTIHFRYSYSLCQGIPNNSGTPVTVDGGVPDQNNPNVNQGGKLTLDTLFFTYRNSDRGKHSPYVFNYNVNDPEQNPDYNNRDIDRWGNYKPNSVSYPHTAGAPNFYPYVDFPYTEQNDYKATSTTNANYLNNKPPNAAVWNLKSIDLPSGGTINVQYESDDYAYVESRRATRMFDIVGIGSYVAEGEERDNAKSSSLTNKPNSGDTYYKIYFPLDSIVPSGTLPSYIAENYIKDIDSIYFKVDVHLKDLENDYVSGYAELDKTIFGFDNSNLTPGGDYKYGFVAVKEVKLSKIHGTKVNPMQRAAIEHLRANRSELVHAPIPYATKFLDQFISLVGSVATLANDLAQTVVGFNWYAFKNGFCEDIRLNGRSVILLQDPDGQKYGGGVRVKKLTINDNWKNSSPDSFEYGQSYDYTITENGKTISSGVAYEPHIGAEESALRSAVNYPLSTPLSSNYHMFLTSPILESYYPGPSVGYRKVSVRSIAPAQALAESPGGNPPPPDPNNLAHTAAPLSIYEFYTAKDFPVLSDQTDLNIDRPITRFLMIPGVYSTLKKRKARSQGYSIVLNDMPGKLRSLTQQTVTGSVISRQEYIYHTQEQYGPEKVNRLSSKVQVLTSEGSYQTGIVGQTHDIFMDMNENKEVNNQGGLDLNLDVSLPVGLPFFIMPVFHRSKSETSLRTVVTMKVIHRTGILKEVITTTDESVIKTENIAYDLETGDPLLTKVTNEFKDPVFNYSLPSHWFYANMGGAYKNLNTIFGSPAFSLSTVSPGRVDIPGTHPAGNYFTEGDEVFVVYSSGTANSCQPLNSVYTVAHVSSVVGNNFINIIDKCGQPAPDGNIGFLTVVRSGYRNMQSLQAGNLVAKTMTVTPFNPQDVANTRKTSPVPFTIDQDNKIIDASAIQFSDIGQTVCANCDGAASVNQVINPWKQGIRGIWKPRRSFAYKTARDQNGNIRNDGMFTDFSLFDWRNPHLSSTKWIAANTITKYSPYGFELENKDAIGRYSAALYGFENSLVTAVGSNAMMREIAFDGFEDYTFNSCFEACLDDDHWGFKDFGGSVTPYINGSQSHSGLYSFVIPPSGAPEFTVTRAVTTATCESFLPLLPGDEEPILPDVILDYTPHITGTCDCIGKFAPEPGKKYVLSAWVKEIPGGQTTPVNTLATYASPKIRVEFEDGSGPIGSPILLDAEGGIIEGWQRIFETFEVPANAVKIKVTPINTTGGGGATVYFDDIRIHPNEGNVVTYVYDGTSLKLAAELDANNYATFYTYDDEGQLTKVKKETIEGIKTIREGRINNVVK